jgi:hypothetical protein
MFFLFKHLLLLNLVIFKLKCNNLIFNEILVLNASYVCLLHSRFVENHPIWILKDGPLIFEVVLSQHPTQLFTMGLSYSLCGEEGQDTAFVRRFLTTQCGDREEQVSAALH